MNQTSLILLCLTLNLTLSLEILYIRLADQQVTPSNLRILTGKKNRQMKLQRLQKVRIWAFWSLVHQINYL